MKESKKQIINEKLIKSTKKEEKENSQNVIECEKSERETQTGKKEKGNKKQRTSL